MAGLNNVDKEKRLSIIKQLAKHCTTKIDIGNEFFFNYTWSNIVQIDAAHCNMVEYAYIMAQDVVMKEM